MTTPRVQAFSSQRIANDKATETHSHDEGSQVAVEAHYLPNIYQDSSDSGTSQGDGQSDNQALVNALRSSNTQQLRTVSGRLQKPEMFDPNSSVPYWTNGSMTFERESKSAQNRRLNWGGYRHKDIGGTGKAAFTPHGQGHELSFADDAGVNASIPREHLAPNTSVPGEFDEQIRHQLYSHQQPKAIRRDRLQVYNLTGVQLRA